MAFQFNQGDRPLPGYTIQRGVGRGGFGEVYYATSDGGKEIALKYLRENPQVELRGVAHCLNLKSPHLVALHDVKQNAEGDHFVIMEYVGGPSLRELLNSESKGLGAQKAAYFLREIGKGLSYLHDRGIVHRDLKPGNIFYEDGYVKIGDYGLAKIMAASQHSGQTVSVGTVHYMAPEVGGGNYDRTIDIYALGVMLYEMLLGRVPYSGATMGEVLMKHLTAQPEVDELPAPFPHVIRKALAKDPKDRYQTVNEMVGEIFKIEDINRSVTSFDTLDLTRMAAAVARRAKAGAAAVHAGGRGGFGSSNAPPLGGSPPVVVQPGGTGPTRWADQPVGGVPPRIPGRDGTLSRLDEFRKHPFGVRDANQHFPQRKRLPTGLLGLFFGGIGIHRFYTGHNSIAVWQLFATTLTGGVAGLWGMIEGIYILARGDYRDALGRPLLGRASEPAPPKPVRQPGWRTPLVRIPWAVFGVLFILTGLGLTAGATFAPPEMEGVGWTVEGRPYYFNMFHLMYVFAPVAMGLGAFSIWKASHRGDLPMYRSTIRPGLMCACLAIMGVGFTLGQSLFAGWLQGIGVAITGVSAVVFTVFWLLRGPEAVRLPGDAYWDRAWKNVFFAATLLSLIGAARVTVGWRDRGAPFHLKDEPILKKVVVHEQIWRRYRSDESELVTYDVPNSVFDHTPLLAGMLVLATVGSFSETRYRRNRLASADHGPDDSEARG